MYTLELGDRGERWDLGSNGEGNSTAPRALSHGPNADQAPVLLNCGRLSCAPKSYAKERRKTSKDTHQLGVTCAQQMVQPASWPPPPPRAAA